MKDENNDKIDQHPDNKIVIIAVDGEKKKIKRGNYSVEEFKKLVEVDQNYDLDQLIDGKFEPVDESKKLHIKGGEIFASHVKTGQSS